MSEFKVGDKVRVTELMGMDADIGLHIGVVGEVKSRIALGAGVTFGPKVRDGGEVGMLSAQLELVTDELPARFKFQTKCSATDAYTAAVDAEQILVSWDHAGGGRIHYHEWEVRKLLRDGDWTITERTVEPTTAEALQAATDALAAAKIALGDRRAVVDELVASLDAAGEKVTEARTAYDKAHREFTEAMHKHHGIS